MSDFENPYNSPESPIIPEKIATVGSLTQTMLNYLKEASPWLRFIGILGFILCGLMALGGVIFIIVSLVLSGYMEEFGNIPIWLFSLLYFAFGSLFFFPARFIYEFGSRIRKYQYSNSDEDLELALKNNKSLWKFYGILCIVYLFHAYFPL